MRTIQLRRVVITGLGAVTDLGPNVPTTWEGMTSGRSGIREITAFEQSDEWSVRFAGEVPDIESLPAVAPRDARRMDRCTVLGMNAAVEAAESSGIDFASGDQYRRGVAIGSGIGGIITIEEGHHRLLEGGPRKISPFTVPRLMVNACAGNVSIRFGLRGANTATATACATGAHAIGAAFHLIQRGDADVMLAGGTEAAVSPICLGSFAAMKALSTRNGDPTKASRPFDRNRDGFVLAEGAAVMVLEELEQAKARGATIYGEILGFGSSGDASHIAAPDEGGAGAVHSMQFALRDAEVDLERVGYINAHGTSTPLGDAAEVAAIKSLFGSHAHSLAVSSTKSMTGHTLGAAGGVEAVFSLLAIRDNVAPPTINLDDPDEACDLDYVPHTARQMEIGAVLSNSFGFGGTNGTLIFRRVD